MYSKYDGHDDIRDFYMSAIVESQTINRIMSREWITQRLSSLQQTGPAGPGMFAPPVRDPNVYGIDMPTRSELIAHGRSDEEIQRLIEADGLVYQDIDAMKRSVSELGPHRTSFEASCFDGVYVCGDVTPVYLDRLEAARELAAIAESDPYSQLNLNLAQAD